MRMALRYPQLISKLIIVDIAPVSSSSSIDHYAEYIDAMQAIDLAHLNSRSEADTLLQSTIPVS